MQYTADREDIRIIVYVQQSSLDEDSALVCRLLGKGLAPMVQSMDVARREDMETASFYRNRLGQILDTRAFDGNYVDVSAVVWFPLMEERPLWCDFNTVTAIFRNDESVTIKSKAFEIIPSYSTPGDMHPAELVDVKFEEVLNERAQKEIDEFRRSFGVEPVAEGKNFTRRTVIQPPLIPLAGK